MYNLYPLVPWLAMFLDMILGDPRTRWHPVVLIGHIISFWERCLYPKNTKPMHAILKGACCVLFVLLTVGGIGGVIIFLATWTSYYVYLVTAAIVLYITITPNSLARDGKEIAHLLMIKNLPLARQKLSWIVGRDTNNLDEGEIARATIETVAENITDGILSPLFYFALFGPMGALLYRASNTMDSMLGYKNQRYLFFGRVAARLDDVLNYIPSPYKQPQCQHYLRPFLYPRLMTMLSERKSQMSIVNTSRLKFLQPVPCEAIEYVQYVKENVKLPWKND